MDSFGQIYYSNKFSIYSTYSIEGLKSAFDNMEAVLNKHLFSYKIDAQKVLSQANCSDVLSVESVKKLNNLYTKIKTQYSSYIDQFLVTACDIINNNYDSNALPF